MCEKGLLFLRASQLLDAPSPNAGKWESQKLKLDIPFLAMQRTFAELWAFLTDQAQVFLSPSSILHEAPLIREAEVSDRVLLAA